MLAAKILSVSAMLAVALPALAAPTTLDFEQVAAATTQLSTTDLYKDLGISFSGAGWGIASVLAQTAPGEGNFYRGKINNPDLSQDPPFFSANRGAVLLQDKTVLTGVPVSFIINVEAGFSDSFDLSYTSDRLGTGNVSIFSGLNGQGSNLGGFGLQGIGSCADTYFCNWKSDTKTLAAGERGRSIVITGSNALFFVDDFSFNLSTKPVPEPGGLALSLAALGALAWARKRTAS